MSYQPPEQQPPIINQTNTTPVTPPSTSQPQDVLSQLLMLVREPWFLATAVVVVITIVVVALILTRRRGGSEFSKELRKRGDAYAIVLDLNTRTVYLTSMKRLSPYRYMYTKDNTKYLFVPIYNKPYVFEGRPCFIAVSGGPSLALELEPVLTLTMSIASHKEGISESDNVKDVIDKLTAEIASSTSKYTTELPSLPGISFEVSIPKYLATLYMTISDKYKALLSALTDSWTAIEEMAKTLKTEKYAGLPHLGRFLLYLGVFVMVIIIALWLGMYFGIFGVGK